VTSKGWSKAWTEELERAVAGAGLPFRVAFAWVEKGNQVWCAELVDRRTGGDRSIRLDASQFATEMERKNEVVRQLGIPQRTSR
jgi:molybdenum-dependent DNA-binding transcriptional regulator ModE